MRQNSVAEKQIKLKREELDLCKSLEDRKQAAKLHKTVKLMLHNTSAIDLELPTPDEIFDTCKQFFAQSNQIGADLELCLCFVKMGLEDVAWFKGTLQVLYTGKFLYMNPCLPSNFSVFVFMRSKQPQGATTTPNMSSFISSKQKEQDSQQTRSKHLQNI